MNKLQVFYLIKHKESREPSLYRYEYYQSFDDLKYGDQVSVNGKPYGWVVGCLTCSRSTFRKAIPYNIRFCQKRFMGNEVRRSANERE